MCLVINILNVNVLVCDNTRHSFSQVSKFSYISNDSLLMNKIDIKMRSIIFHTVFTHREITIDTYTWSRLEFVGALALIDTSYPVSLTMKSITQVTYRAQEAEPDSSVTIDVPRLSKLRCIYGSCFNVRVEIRHGVFVWGASGDLSLRRILSKFSGNACRIL